MKFFRFNRHTGEIEFEPESPPPVAPRPQYQGELVRLIAAELDQSQSDVDAVVKCLLSRVTASLKAGKTVVFAGFGRFKPRKCRRGKSRNPRTGKPVKATGRRSVTFRPSTRLKARLESRIVSLLCHFDNGHLRVRHEA